MMSMRAADTSTRRIDYLFIRCVIVSLYVIVPVQRLQEVMSL